TFLSLLAPDADFRYPPGMLAVRLYQRVSPEEYLEGEPHGQIKHEYIDGGSPCNGRRRETISSGEFTLASVGLTMALAELTTI
ncbi:MAG: hypothetical protein KDN22_21465, partial [Verrucomicrobiae bacterium]|nr:hypothetical protein [Verrucomicrobiae bacterium]